MAKTKGTAGKTLIRKGLLSIFFGTDKQAQMVNKGLYGERQIGKALKQLPDGWRVWHDLDIGGENIDHLVASAKGVFIIEVKNYTGAVLAHPTGLYSHGNKKPNAKVTAQVWRQVTKLKERLGGQWVQPVLVFLEGVNAPEGTVGVPPVPQGALFDARGTRALSERAKERAALCRG